MSKKKWWLFLSLAVVLFFVFQLSNQRSLSFHFVDEEEHIVTASFMNQGYRVYQDLSVNHQPLVYLGSSWLQKIIKPQSIFLLIKWHRLAVFGYAALWSVLLVWRFGLVGLLFAGVFEWLKFYSFGNLWLMESLAVYPAVYLFASFLEAGLSNKWPKKRESIFLGFSSFLVMFNLVPLWPWLGLIWLVYLIKNRKMFLRQLVGLLIPTAILFILVSPIDWFRETINYNVIYAMPQLSTVKTVDDWLKIIFFPLVSFLTRNSFQAGVIRWLFSGFLISWLVVKKRKIGWLILIYFLLVLSNLRVSSPGAVFYDGFHLLPWTGLLLISFLICLKQVKNRAVLAVFAVLGIGLFLNRNMPYFWQTDSVNEYHINYSRFDDLNFAVKILTEPGDRLAILTGESLIYWNTGVKPATRQVVYYAWEHDVPRLKEEYKKAFYDDDPPEFIFGGQEAGLSNDKYIPLLRNGQPTELFIRKDKAEDVNQKQVDQLALREFSIIEKLMD